MVETLNENTLLNEIITDYPDLHGFIERRYGVPLSNEDMTIRLTDFVSKYRLPPAPIVLMEIQLAHLQKAIEEIPPKKVAAWIQEKKEVKLVDVREDWERKLCPLPNSQALTASLLDRILNEWEKNDLIVLFCHFGIRSKDAATFLADRGFQQVFIIRGGIDAWSNDVDPSIPKYDGQYC